MKTYANMDKPFTIWRRRRVSTWKARLKRWAMTLNSAKVINPSVCVWTQTDKRWRLSVCVVFLVYYG